jgi:hypothetical protein
MDVPPSCRDCRKRPAAFRDTTGRLSAVGEGAPRTNESVSGGSTRLSLVAAITQPSSEADLALTVVPVVAWSLWAFARNVPLAAVSLAIVVPVVLVQRSGELEPVMFNVSLLAFAAARWSRWLASAASLGVLAAATPVLVALVQDPMEVAVALSTLPP